MAARKPSFRWEERRNGGRRFVRYFESEQPAPKPVPVPQEAVVIEPPDPATIVETPLEDVPAEPLEEVGKPAPRRRGRPKKASTNG